MGLVTLMKVKTHVYVAVIVACITGIHPTCDLHQLLALDPGLDHLRNRLKGYEKKNDYCNSHATFSWRESGRWLKYLNLCLTTITSTSLHTLDLLESLLTISAGNWLEFVMLYRQDALKQTTRFIVMHIIRGVRFTI
jgi:hypothetical protein